MGFLKYSVFVCFLVFGSIDASPIEVNDLTRGTSEFAKDFYSKCVQTKPVNVLVSPLSVANALALLSQGASGKTFDELKTGLQLSSDKTVMADQFLQHRELLQKNAGEAALKIANKVYVQQGKKLNKNFEDVAVSKFKSGVESLNFADSANSAQVINSFVEGKTNGKIKDLFKPDQLNSDTRSVLVNAVYFKGNWEHQFNKQYTRKDDFYNTESEKVPVDFMFLDETLNMAYLQDLEASALEMKYANSSLSFVIVLPYSRTLGDLAELESKLKEYDWAKITEKMTPREVHVNIPKFKVEYEINLNEVLKNLGMTEMFSESSNLNGILESGEPLKVSDVIHKAYIEVDEEGTEAAAATGVGIMLMSLPPQFKVDHPFMYFIRDTETNTVLFSGRIEKF